MLGKLQSDLKQAQRQRDETRVSTLRLLLSEIHNSEIAKGQPLTDSEIINLIQREIKKRNESAAGFRQGGREEAAKKEEEEAGILKSYLPPQMSDEELTKVVQDSINEVGAKTLADMGRVISLVMSKVAGQADGARVAKIVKEEIGNG